jgi:hypothetical protein
LVDEERIVAETLRGSSVAVASGTTQARLILQDPMAFDQATQPNLRASMELTATQGPELEREKARELWESLSLEPELALEKQSERKRLLAKAEAAAQDATAARAQTRELEARLATERQERLNHPLVYAGAFALLGMGALWWLERRKRLQLQERELALLAQETPSLLDEDVQLQSQASQMPYSLEDSPDLASDFATDLSGLPGSPYYTEKTNQRFDAVLTRPDKSPHSPTAPIPTLDAVPPVSQEHELRSMPEWAQPMNTSESDARLSHQETAAQSWQAEDRSLLGMSKRVLANIWKRKSQRDALHSSQLSTQSPSGEHTESSHLSTHFLPHEADHDSTQMPFDEEARRAFEQELIAHNNESLQGEGYDPDQANIDLLSQTRVVPERGESAMEHLLELRTAVNGLTVLGRPEGAAKLLLEHISAEPGTCAWAYLEYMHVCEQMDRRDDFEAMRKQYRQQFNRMASYWYEPNSNVLGLDGYARAANELCTAWTLGIEHARQTLASWLIGPLLGRKLVQLPAYHDLFDLYEMLEYAQQQPVVQAVNTVASVPSSEKSAHSAISGRPAHAFAEPLGEDATWADEAEQDFVPTVSLLDLDYEFSSDVTLEEREVRESEKAVTVVKTGNFTVDFNVAGTQMGALPSIPAEIGKK